MKVLSLEFKAQPSKEVEGLPKSITGVEYTGAMIKNHGALVDVVVDLSDISIPEKMLLLNDHNRSDRFGLCRVRKEGNSLMLNAVILEDETTLTFRRQLALGLPIGLSIGVIGNFEKPNAAVRVNGNLVKPDTIIRNAKLLEVSVVSFGADSDAMITAAFKNEQADHERQLSAFLFTQVANAHVLNL